MSNGGIITSLGRNNLLNRDYKSSPDYEDVIQRLQKSLVKIPPIWK